MTQASIPQPMRSQPLAYRQARGGVLATAQHSRLAEWYLTLCFVGLLLEGGFNGFLTYHVAERSTFLLRLTPYNLMPSALYFYSVGFLIGLGILISGRRPWHAPTKGQWAYIGMWAVYGGGCMYGMLRGRPAWLGDMRSFILPSLVVPWMVLLGKSIRLEVVIKRLIPLAVPIALINMTLGILFFARGASTKSELAPEWPNAYILMLFYCLAFARSISSGKRQTFVLLILAAGIVAPLHKPALGTFLIANVSILTLGTYLGRRQRKLRLGNATIVLTALLMGGMLFIPLVLSAGQGAGKAHLLNRIFKYDQAANTRDVTGGRIRLWTWCLQRWAEEPVIGVGLGERLVVGGRDGIEAHYLPIHNLYVQTLMQTGALGFAIVTLCVLTWMARTMRSIAHEADPAWFWPRLGMLAWIITILGSCAFGGALESRVISFTLWSLVALETAAHSQRAGVTTPIRRITTRRPAARAPYPTPANQP